MLHLEHLKKHRLVESHLLGQLRGATQPVCQFLLLHGMEPHRELE